jgi:anti-anti-sigma factor
MINIEKRNKIDIISFSVNKINATVIDDIREGVSKEFDTPNSKVVVDLGGVDYIDSSGFASFLYMNKSARNNYGTLKFANLEPRVKELFQALHLHTVFEIYDDLEECIKSFR